MSAKHFGYYDDWKTATLTCPKCGWSGTFEQGTVEHHNDLMDSSCPACDCLDSPMLAIVSYPTIADSRANWGKVSDADRAQVQSVERLQRLNSLKSRTFGNGLR